MNRSSDHSSRRIIPVQFWEVLHTFQYFFLKYWTRRRRHKGFFMLKSFLAAVLLSASVSCMRDFLEAFGVCCEKIKREIHVFQLFLMNLITYITRKRCQVTLTPLHYTTLHYTLLPYSMHCNLVYKGML